MLPNWNFGRVTADEYGAPPATCRSQSAQAAAVLGERLTSREHDGECWSGQLMPPDQPLCEHFNIARCVVPLRHEGFSFSVTWPAALHCTSSLACAGRVRSTRRGDYLTSVRSVARRLPIGTGTDRAARQSRREILQSSTRKTKTRLQPPHTTGFSSGAGHALRRAANRSRSKRRRKVCGGRHRRSRSWRCTRGCGSRRDSVPAA